MVTREYIDPLTNRVITESFNPGSSDNDPDDWNNSKVLNPKLAAGSVKRGFQSVPPSAFVYLAQAMDDGANKYGQMNWRESKVIASIYIDAAMRHLLSWADGEEVADDSKVHHLAHVMACMAIVLDAKRLGVLVDDRHIPGDMSNFLEEEKNAISQRKST